jgi:protocatechuate 3,4-dioxygenase beta subunit
MRSVALCAVFWPAALGLSAQTTSPGLRPTVALTEGPFYKAGSPERRDLAPAGSPGRHITVSGTVFDLDGRPIAGAWLDFWQADSAGRYDNEGFQFRGHQFTDAAGHYVLTTVVPGEYPGRTQHIHVKLCAPGGRTLTTQIFFPGSAGNERDPIFDKSLVIAMSADGKSGRIDFTIPGS